MAMTREDKYGNKCEVEKYHCGSCKHYEFEDDDDRNRCSHFYAYYYKDDSCSSNWEEADDCSSSADGCFLTSACCEYMGLPDDCEELQTLRRFRDEVLDRTITGHSLKLHYYEVAPKLLQKLEGRNDRNEILARLYEEIKNIIALIREGREKDAIAGYMLMTLNFEEQLG
ncbi:MAG: hypothetical protein IJL66_08540 [Lachnospiraceae bacterium]|nr:hypothetical protein [Lachnospiraceae bacterium]